MRSALWETSPGALVALLQSGAPLTKDDLYTITMVDGTVIRWSGADRAITANGHTWALGPGIRRSRVRWTVGVEVDSLTVQVTDNAGTTINGKPLIAAIRAGLLLGATLQLDRAFSGPGDVTPRGALVWFAGEIAPGPFDRYEAQLTVKSTLNRLAVMVPRDVYQAPCLNTLFDARCGLSRSALSVAGTVTVASTGTRLTFGHALGQPAGYFELGVVQFTTGANAGVRRTVRQHTSGQLVALQPWPFPVLVGDSFSVYPGCDKRLATCTTKFSNRLRFRGQHAIPVPDTVT